MRRLFLFMMVTLDGYFEGEDHDFSWPNADNQEFHDFALENLSNTDAIVMGHRTYDLMNEHWPTMEAKRDDPDTAAFMSNTMKYIAAHQDFDPGWEQALVKVGDPKQWVRDLKNSDGKDIVILGSNELSVSLVEAGLIDEYQLMYNPVAIGSGTPLFKGLQGRLNFQLTTQRAFANGNVLLTYKQR